MALAKEAFDLKNLNELKIYNEQHQFISNARLKRVEYVIDVNGYFVAVYKPEKSIPPINLGYYCLSNSKIGLKIIKTTSEESKELTERIKRELAVDPEYIWGVEHKSLQPYETIFSLFAYQQKNGQTITYLTELKEGKLNILYKLQDDTALEGLLPLPIEVNGKPVLLLHNFLPDSDAVDDYLVAVYNGKEYKVVDNNRVKI